jgi:hypothetical protein
MLDGLGTARILEFSVSLLSTTDVYLDAQGLQRASMRVDGRRWVMVWYGTVRYICIAHAKENTHAARIGRWAGCNRGALTRSSYMRLSMLVWYRRVPRGGCDWVAGP